MIKRFIYRTAGAGSEGGAGFSISDLDNDDDVIVPPVIPIVPDPKADVDLEAEREAQRLKDEEEAEKAKTKIPEPKKEEAPTLDPKEDPKKDEPLEEVDEAEAFFAEVDSLRGDSLEVEYGEVDPLSPQGIVLRDEIVKETAIAEFEGYLESKYPKAYGYLLHTMSGQPEDEYFGKVNLEVLPTEAELEGSVEIQKATVMKDLLTKGVSEKAADRIIKGAIEDDELEEMSKDALTEISKNQAAEIDRVKNLNDQAVQVRTDAIKQMSDYVKEVVTTGKIGNITIPEKDRAAFTKTFNDRVRYDNGKFSLVTEITNDNVQALFGKEYYDFKKGDLAGLVSIEAKTENARRLKRSLPKQSVPKGGAEDKSRLVPMSEMEAD